MTELKNLNIDPACSTLNDDLFNPDFFTFRIIPSLKMVIGTDFIHTVELHDHISGKTVINIFEHPQTKEIRIFFRGIKFQHIREAFTLTHQKKYIFSYKGNFRPIFSVQIAGALICSAEKRVQTVEVFEIRHQKIKDVLTPTISVTVTNLAQSFTNYLGMLYGTCKRKKQGCIMSSSDKKYV